MTSRAIAIAAASAFGAAVVSAAVAARAGGDPLDSQVIFGTACARCHEGECSGRLSFDRDSEAAATHIQRYAGERAGASIEEYFAHLERMKKDCSYAPMHVGPAEGGVFPRPLLERLCVASQQSCFIPLGELAPAEYRLSFGFAEERHVHAEVVTAAFELVLEAYLELDGQSATADLSVPERAEHFLRLRADGPLRLQSLVVRPR